METTIFRGYVSFREGVVWLDVSANCCVNVLGLPSFLTCEEMGLTKVDTKENMK